MQSLIAPFFNLVVLIGILFYYLRDPVKNFVRNRHSFIRDEVIRVGNELTNAQAKFEEFSAKLKAIEAEIVSFRTQARQDAESTKLKIITEAKKLSGQIVSDSQTLSNSLSGELKKELRAELGLRAIDRAEEIIKSRLTGDDRTRIRQDFTRQVGAIG